MPKRRWLLVSKSSGEDIYGRPVSLVANTLMHGGAAAVAVARKAICARLLKSGRSVEGGWGDMSRAVGGRRVRSRWQSSLPLSASPTRVSSR